MEQTTLILLLAASAVMAFFLGKARSLRVAGDAGVAVLHSLPKHYGYYVLLWSLLPPLFLMCAWLFLESRVVMLMVLQDLPGERRPADPGQLDLLVNNIRNLAAGDIVSGSIDATLSRAAERYAALVERSRWLLAAGTLGAAALGLFWSRSQISPELRARNRVERVTLYFLVAASSIAVLTTVGIVMSVLVEALRFFREVPVTEFLFGLNWSPQTAIRADQVGSSGSFGALPLFTGTLLVTAIAMCVALPIGLMSAIWLAEYSPRRVRAVAKPMLEILAGIPTVVYGFFAALTVAPWVRALGEGLGFDVASESALAAGLVMGIMIIPLVSSLSDDAIHAVPGELRDGALALGATRSEAITRVILPAAMPGIVGGMLLAVSRAIGETMIVVMAAGLAANLTANPFEAVTTVTVQIVTLLVGDQEFDSAKTLAAFALGLVLFLATLLLNVIGLGVVRKYRERYE
jgi:phosphate transport system permease protein